jgi:hypothetical protein
MALHRPRALRVATALALVLVAAVLAAACGASPYRFVSNKSAGVYLKVPRGWTEVPRDALLPLYGQGDSEPSPEAFQMLKSVLWERAWDASSAPAVSHFALGGAPTDPVARVNVRRLLPAERDQVSLQNLRQLLLGAYDQDLQDFKQLIRNPGTSEIVSADFVPLQDAELHVTGHLGIRQVFEARKADQTLYTVGFIALVDDARTQLSTLTVHCSQQCFAANQHAIAAVLDSFTVR